MTELTHEHAHDEIHLPSPTAWPLVLGLGFLVMTLGLVLKSGRIESLSTISPIWYVVSGVGGLILAVGLGGWLLRNVADRQHPGAFAGDSKMAMWMFLGNEVLFFTGLIASFLLLRSEAAPGVDHPLVNSIPLVGLNTFILLTSSLTVVLAHDAAVRGKQMQLRVCLLLTIILGTAFVSLQGVEYSTLYAEGLKWTGDGYGTAFFTLTGTHGLHVIIGIIWCIVIFIRALMGGFNEKHYGGVEIFGLYWHFVDIVWILLFTLVYLMHTPAPETAGMALRGLGLW